MRSPSATITSSGASSPNGTLGAGHDRHAGADGRLRARPSCCPSARIAVGDGPTNVRPASTQACAKSSFSARNPYPGWTSVAPGASRRVDDVDRCAGSSRRPDSRRCGCASSASRTCSAVAIAVGVDGDGRQAHLAAGANDADGDFAAVGDRGPSSQRDVPVLPRRILVALVLAAGERGDELGARLARLDDLVDEAARRRRRTDSRASRGTPRRASRAAPPDPRPPAARGGRGCSPRLPAPSPRSPPSDTRS